MSEEQSERIEKAEKTGNKSLPKRKGPTKALASVVLVLLFIAALAVAIAGKNNNTNNTSSSSNTSSTASDNNATIPVNSASPSASSTTTEPYTVGDSITLGSLSVTLNNVTDPATGADEFNTPNAGDRFVAVDVTIKNNGTSTYSDDANSQITVVGTDNQDYTFDTDSVSECTNFDYGQYSLASGDSISGCVVFQLPTSVSSSKVEFNAENGGGGEWTIQ